MDFQLNFDKAVPHIQGYFFLRASNDTWGSGKLPEWIGKAMVKLPKKLSQIEFLNVHLTGNIPFQLNYPGLHPNMKLFLKS